MMETNFIPFPEIKTERLLLRKVVQDDVENFYLLRSNKEVMKYIEHRLATTMEEARLHCQKIIDALEENSGISWAITLIEKPLQLIGSIGFWRLIKDHYRAEIGYTLHPDYWRKGYIKEAINAVLKYGFEAMQLHSVEAQINPKNKASAASLEATGFVQEGHFKENFYFDGVYYDTLVYSLLKDPWNQNK